MATAPTWSIDAANIALTNNDDGGFAVDVPITLDGTKVADIEGVMTGAGNLTITLKLGPDAVPITGFQAWSTRP
jgi:hypothetical protein